MTIAVGEGVGPAAVALAVELAALAEVEAALLALDVLATAALEALAALVAAEADMLALVLLTTACAAPPQAASRPVAAPLANRARQARRERRRLDMHSLQWCTFAEDTGSVC
jgi:hypothetical protein